MGIIEYDGRPVMADINKEEGCIDIKVMQAPGDCPNTYSTDEMSSCLGDCGGIYALLSSNIISPDLKLEKILIKHVFEPVSGGMDKTGFSYDEAFRLCKSTLSKKFDELPSHDVEITHKGVYVGHYMPCALAEPMDVANDKRAAPLMFFIINNFADILQSSGIIISGEYIFKKGDSFIIGGSYLPLQ